MLRSKVGFQPVRTKPMGKTSVELCSMWSRILSPDINPASMILKCYLKQSNSSDTVSLGVELRFGYDSALKSWHVDIEMLLGSFCPSLPGTVFSRQHPTRWLPKFHISPIDRCAIGVLKPIYVFMMFLEHLSYLPNTPSDHMRTPPRGLILRRAISPITR